MSAIAQSRVKPPNSIEAEREVLSAVLVDPDAVDTLRARLKAEDFYLAQHKILFEAFVGMREKETAIDAVTIQQTLRDRGQYEKVGGARALGELLDRAGTVSNLQHYCTIVRRKSLERQIVEESVGIHTDMVSDLDEAQERVEKRIAKIGVLHAALSQVGKPRRKWEDAVFETVSRGTNKQKPKPRIPWGIPSLDAKCNGGTKRGWLVVINALSGGGKTALAHNNLVYSACMEGYRVVEVSLEMGDEELAERTLARQTGIEAWRFDQGSVPETRWIDVVDAGMEVADFDLVVEEHASSWAAIESAVLEAHQEKPIDMFVVDYGQLVDNGLEGESNFAKTSRGAKLLAKKLDCVGVVLVQSTVLANRAGTAPGAADGKGSGAWQADSDLYIAPFIIEPKDGDRPDVCPAEIYVRKQRKGKTGKVEGLVFDGPRCMFREATFAEIQKGVGLSPKAPVGR